MVLLLFSYRFVSVFAKLLIEVSGCDSFTEHSILEASWRCVMMLPLIVMLSGISALGIASVILVTKR